MLQLDYNIIKKNRVILKQNQKFELSNNKKYEIKYKINLNW